MPCLSPNFWFVQGTPVLMKLQRCTTWHVNYDRSSLSFWQCIFSNWQNPSPGHRRGRLCRDWWLSFPLSTQRLSQNANTHSNPSSLQILLLTRCPWEPDHCFAGNGTAARVESPCAASFHHSGTVWTCSRLKHKFANISWKMAGISLLLRRTFEFVGAKEGAVPQRLDLIAALLSEAKSALGSDPLELLSESGGYRLTNQFRQISWRIADTMAAQFASKLHSQISTAHTNLSYIIHPLEIENVRGSGSTHTLQLIAQEKFL